MQFSHAIARRRTEGQRALDVEESKCPEEQRAFAVEFESGQSDAKRDEDQHSIGKVAIVAHLSTFVSAENDGESIQVSENCYDSCSLEYFCEREKRRRKYSSKQKS